MSRLHSRSLTALTTASLLALVLSGCSAGASPDNANDPAQSPLSKYMNAIYGVGGDEEDWQKDAIEQNKKIEALVAKCMTAEGFEYKPQDSSAMFSGASSQEWNPDDEEWVAQYGYGSVNYPGRDEPTDTENMPVDPNQEYVASLSESEQTAFYETLYGKPPAEEDLGEDGSYESTWEQQGCYGAASHETQGEDPMQLDEHKPLMDAMQKFWEAQATSSELSEIDAEWASCMQDQGQSGFSKQPDAQASIQDELNKFYESQTEYVENDPQLDELGKKEIALALVDLQCREDTDYRAKAQKVSFALEEQFIADHKAELEALKADAEQARK